MGTIMRKKLILLARVCMALVCGLCASALADGVAYLDDQGAEQTCESYTVLS